jgi:hypothetical protein
VDGIVYYSIERDAALRKYIAEERKRLIQKMIAEKKSGAPVRPATNTLTPSLSCDEEGD